MIEISKHTLMILGVIWVIFCSYRGHQKGFLREVYTLAELVLALVFVWFLAGHFQILAQGAYQIGGFLVIWFVLRWIGKFLNLVNRIPVLGGLNRTLGVLLGFFLGLLVLGFVYMTILQTGAK
jgi:uncharacterized membrane protein required for colicin V production